MAGTKPAVISMEARCRRQAPPSDEAVKMLAHALFHDFDFEFDRWVWFSGLKPDCVDGLGCHGDRIPAL
jgi:hypothetical protein